MATEAEDQLTDAMRRAVEDTQFDPAAIAKARTTVRRRRQVLAGLGAAVVLAGAGIGVANLGGTSGENDVVSTGGEEVRIMTQPEAGDNYLAAQLSGTLVVTDEQCLAVKHGSAETPLVYSIYWPNGFTAARDTAGQATVYNADGQPIAHEGDTVSIGGGLMPENVDFPQKDHPCAVGEIWVAAPDVEVLDQ